MNPNERGQLRAVDLWQSPTEGVLLDVWRRTEEGRYEYATATHLTTTERRLIVDWMVGMIYKQGWWMKPWRDVWGYSLRRS